MVGAMTDDEAEPTPEEQKAAFAQAIAELTAMFEDEVHVRDPSERHYDLVYQIATEHPPTMLRIVAWNHLGLQLLHLAADGDPEVAQQLLRELALQRAT
jgi:hypothetical protein